MDDLTFFYVVEGTRLQTQAILLAHSLRAVHPESAQIAYTPTESVAALSPDFCRIMDALSVRRMPIPTPNSVWKAPYPHGNKILATAQPRQSRRSIFLDSDMFAIARISESDLPDDLEVSVVPEGVIGWGEDFTRWERVYSHFSLPVPEERIRLMRGAKRLSPPYFNAGFVAINEADRVGGKNFGELWLETASEIDWRVPVGGKRPWLDQISLPVTMQRFGFRSKVVDERNNTSISHDRDLTELDPSIIHYHRSRFFRRWPAAGDAIAEIVQSIPSENQDWMRNSLIGAGFIDADQ